MEKQKRRLAYLLIAPSALWLLLFIGLPIVDTIRTSFYHTSYKGVRFVGLENYFNILFKDDLFRLVLNNSIIWTGASVFLNVVFGLLIALLLSRSSIFSEIARGTLILAWATPLVVAGIIWKWMYNAEYGQLNSLLFSLHLIDEPVQWLTNARSAFVGALIARFWTAFPFTTFAFLSGLQSIPTDLYEAAIVDGASGWQRFWKVTLPLLRPVTLAVLLISVIWSFNSFAFIYVITGGGPANKTQIMVTEIFRRGFAYFNFGSASTLAVISFFFLLIVSIVQWRLFYREEA
ncbi:MAG: sugar ABC transporter permease [Chloroflexota bacterium]|nr:sugar ABC transporter permease [Chloroflexota bacterium]